MLYFAVLTKYWKERGKVEYFMRNRSFVQKSLNYFINICQILLISSDLFFCAEALSDHHVITCYSVRDHYANFLCLPFECVCNLER